jgi:hypothetical protein
MKIATVEDFLNWPKHDEESEYWSTDLIGLQFAARNANPDVEQYLRIRAYRDSGVGKVQISTTLKHGIARLEWVLREGRQQISDLFTEDEFTSMLNWYLSGFITYHSCMEMAPAMCTHLGIECDEYEKSEHASFIDRLLSLTPCQRAALADALELAWKPSLNVFEWLEDMGLTFR